MKRIEILVRQEEAEKAEETMRSLDLVYTSVDTKADDSKCFIFSTVVPDDMLDAAMDKLSKSMDQRLKTNMISVFDVKATISSHLERLKERTAEEKRAPNPLESIVQPLDRYLKLNFDILAMAGISSLIALAGLVLNNIAIIIGAMLLSPLLGPINAVNVNISLGQLRKLLRAILLSLALIATVIDVSFVVSRAALGLISIPTTE